MLCGRLFAVVSIALFSLFPRASTLEEASRKIIDDLTKSVLKFQEDPPANKEIKTFAIYMIQYDFLRALGPVIEYLSREQPTIQEREEFIRVLRDFDKALAKEGEGWMYLDTSLSGINDLGTIVSFVGTEGFKKLAHLHYDMEVLRDKSVLELSEIYIQGIPLSASLFQLLVKNIRGVQDQEQIAIYKLPFYNPTNDFGPLIAAVSEVRAPERGAFLKSIIQELTRRRLLVEHRQQLVDLITNSVSLLAWQNGALTRPLLMIADDAQVTSIVNSLRNVNDIVLRNVLPHVITRLSSLGSLGAHEALLHDVIQKLPERTGNVY
jgi:hypothetical protein